MRTNILTLIGSILLFLPLFAPAQSIEIIDFPQFEERVDRSYDTLYIYNFWATWCGPCIKELPYFTQLETNYSQQKVKVEYISLDLIEQLDGAVKTMVSKKLPHSKVLLLDAPKYHEWIDKVHPDWSGAIPATLFTYNKREIYEFQQKSFTYEELSSQVDAFLSTITSK